MDRETISYRATNQIFIQKEKNYIQQYSHIYLKRLLALRPFLEKVEVQIIDKIIALKVGEYVGVIGTLYKEQKLKPCVLDEFTSDFGVVDKPALDNYSGEDDFLLLEDESGRCVLSGESDFWKEQVSKLLTGVVVCCIGVLNEVGTFMVSELVFPGDGIQPSLSQQQQSSSSLNPSRYLLLTSGICSGSVSENHSIALQLLIDFVGGNLNPELGSSIVRIVVAGGGFSPPKLGLNLDGKINSETQEMLVEPLRVSDRFFAELSSLVPVDLMPGEMDPCGTSIPQQALHRCLFPIAGRLNSTFRPVTNPYSFILADKISILGHSGQPTKDALKYVKPGLTPLDFLISSLLDYRHLAPTAPDTLVCYPFFDRDPFVIENSDVNIFFSGDCPKFETKFVNNTRFVCIPNFHSTRQVVMVDLNSPDFQTQVMTFNIQN